LEGLARRHGVPLLFDAAHGMGCRLNGVPLAALGDASLLSFHATKPFTTLEGGAVVTGRQEIAERVRLLSDFGFDSEDHVLFPGMNAKMNEAEAAMGLVTLPRLAEEIADRGGGGGVFRVGLAGCPGLTLASLPEGLESNHAYFPIRIEAGAFGMDRGQLMAVLRGHNVFSRAYFETLGSDLPWYRDLASAQAEHLPESIRAARETLCLPMFADLPLEAAAKIAGIIRGA
jgi:dTDP-4-amino-4,6-dideoxygalactose transaminase